MATQEEYKFIEYISEDPNKPFYFFNMLKRFKMVFSSLFDNIYIYDHIINNLKEVSVIFSTKNKLFMFEDRQELQLNAYIKQLPIIGIQPMSLTYVPEQQISPYSKMNNAKDYFFNEGTKKSPQIKSMKSFFTPRPYLMNYDVNILSVNIATMDQILEQILPQFVPEISLDIDVPMLEKYTSNIKLNDVSMNDELELNVDQERVITSTLSFEQSLILFPPVKDAELITQMKTRLGFDNRREYDR
jgi:hypothetical protein